MGRCLACTNRNKSNLMERIKMYGIPEYIIRYTTVTIRIERIVNMDNEHPTNALSVRFYAFKTLESTGQSYLFAEIDLEPIPAAHEIVNFEKTVPFRNIPNGYFYPAIALSKRDERSPSGWAINDIHRFENAEFFGKKISLNKTSFSFSNKTIRINVSEIQNNSKSISGKLLAEFILTKELYKKGDVNGYKIWSQEIDELEPDFCYSDVEWEIICPDIIVTHQHGLLFLKEKVNEEWLPLDYHSDLIKNLHDVKEIVIDPKKTINTLQKLDKMIGLTDVKKAMKDLESLASYFEKKGKYELEKDSHSLHMCFTGPPGTGKTTVARIVGQILYENKLIENDNFIEVTRSDLVGGYMGQTENKTHNVIQKALGGVLFIDEAYSLSEPSYSGSDADYGKEAIEELISAMENERHRMCVIFAGYTKEMQNFLDINPGLKSRIFNVIEFPDYSEVELWEIFIRMLDDRKMSCDLSIRENFIARMKQLKSSQKAGQFGNAREVRNIIDKSIIALARRTKQLKNPSKEQLTKLIPEDVSFLKSEDKDEKTSRQDPIKELNSLIGLDSIKEKLIAFKDWTLLSKKRLALGLNSRTITTHMCFTGSPGTGKTTVARLAGRILSDCGLLPSDKFSEITRSDLVSGYLGKTGLKTREVIEKSLGGVLFIDEAYALTEHYQHGGTQDYGIDVINELISSMENYRDRLCVIFAGYTDKMNDFLRANPGMESRISGIFEFPDYDENELWQIFQLMIAKNGLNCDSSIETDFKNYIIEKKSSSPRGEFGNAREARNILDRAEKELASRISSVVDPGREELMTLIPDDFSFLSEIDQTIKKKSLDQNIDESEIVNLLIDRLNNDIKDDKVDEERAVFLKNVLDEFYRRNQNILDIPDGISLFEKLKLEITSLIQKKGTIHEITKFLVESMKNPSYGLPLPPSGSRAEVLRELIWPLRRAVIEAIMNSPMGNYDKEEAYELMKQATELDRKLLEIGSDDNETLDFESSRLRIFAQRIRNFIMRKQIFIAQPIFGNPKNSWSANTIYFNGCSEIEATLKQVCSDLKMRLSEQSTTNNELQDNFVQILQSNICIFDLGSMPGPKQASVAYSLGIAITLGKPVALLGDVSVKIPFNVDLPVEMLDKKANNQDILANALMRACYQIYSGTTIENNKVVIQEIEEKFVTFQGDASTDYLMKTIKSESKQTDWLFLNTTIQQFIGNTNQSNKLLLCYPRYQKLYTTAKEKRLFHVMPFGMSWSDNIMEVTREICNKKTEYIRGDQVIEPNIIKSIWDEICKATHVLVDITDSNSNVALELGIAHCMGKNIRLIGQSNIEMALFQDIAKLRIIPYSMDNLKSYRTLVDNFISD